MKHTEKRIKKKKNQSISDPTIHVIGDHEREEEEEGNQKNI